MSVKRLAGRSRIFHMLISSPVSKKVKQSRNCQTITQQYHYKSNLHFRQELKEIDCVSETIGWNCMLAKIKERLLYDWNKKIYLILSDGWVYEGYIDIITDVLSEVDGWLDDFYIVSSF